MECTADAHGNRLIETGAAETDYAVCCDRNILGGCATDETEWSEKLGLRPAHRCSWLRTLLSEPGASKWP